MHFNSRMRIEEWKEKHSYNYKTLRRIISYLQHPKYAMEITDFQDTNKISLEQLRIDFLGFVVPKMYYLLMKRLCYVGKILIPCREKIVHDFSNITSEQICKE